MPQRLTFEYNPLSYAYPDDESDKELFFQTSNSSSSHLRAAFIYWVNIVFDDGEEVWQVVRLDEHNGRLKYVYPDLIVVDGCEQREHSPTYSLGVFTRDQREAVLEYADEVEYGDNAQAGGEKQCQEWMGRLLQHMITGDLLECGVVDRIRNAVPLS